MGKLMQTNNRMTRGGGGTLPDDCMSFVSYIVSFVVFVMAIYTIYVPVISLFGIILLYFMNAVYSVLLAKDLFSSPKSADSPLIVFIFVAILGLNIASSTMIMLAIRKINADYSKKSQKMELSEKTRNILSVYIAAWIFTIIMVWVLSLFYFMEPATKSFFSYEFVGAELSPFFMMMGFIIKVAFSALSLALSGYMVYKANYFFDAKAKVLV